MARVDKDTYFMSMAVLASARSTCLRRRVGAVLVKHGMVISTGYNGAPKGLDHCKDVGCIRQERNIPSGQQAQLCRAGHAEANAIVQAAYIGTPIDGSHLYTTLIPCSFCSTLIINGGIARVVHGNPYPETLGYKMLVESGIELVDMSNEMP